MKWKEGEKGKEREGTKSCWKHSQQHFHFSVKGNDKKNQTQPNHNIHYREVKRETTRMGTLLANSENVPQIIIKETH